MKSNNRLLNSVFKNYLKKCFIITIFVAILACILIPIINNYIYNNFENAYMFYRSLYLLFPTIIIWALLIMLETYKLFKKLVSYVDELQEATNKLFDKDNNYIHLSDELSEISTKINKLKMQSIENERLANENRRQKNDLIMNLAHDLKTPLASIIGYLELLNGNISLYDEQRKKFLGIALRKSKQLSDLINEFFEITKYNLSKIKINYSRTNLTMMLEQLVFEFKPMFEEKNLTCKVKAEKNVMISCDVNKISRVFDNLLRNACLYSFENSEIHIDLNVKEEKVEIIFENKTESIEEDKLSKIFEQFYRLDFSRNSKGGSGLGLAIAKEIVLLHKGEISAESKDNCVKFCVILPKK
ncbi:MAG: HAMP domain-containing sensor histidine kinase [Anaerococcus sp.]|nr:HAMP domain-containing sensor histidine kinase [Anaerococcus sp.]